MPKQSLKLRNSKKVLAAVAVTVAVASAPLVSSANELQPKFGIDAENQDPTFGGFEEDIDPGFGVDAENQDPTFGGFEEDIDPGFGVDAEGQDPTFGGFEEDIDPDFGVDYEGPTLNQPAEPGFGPLGPVTPALDANIGNKKVKAQKTVKYTNPKTGDSSVLGYAGIGLASVAGLFRKRK